MLVDVLVHVLVDVIVDVDVIGFLFDYCQNANPRRRGSATSTHTYAHVHEHSHENVHTHVHDQDLDMIDASSDDHECAIGGCYGRLTSPWMVIGNMATPVEAPKLGNTVEECIVLKWYKRRGDSVSAGDLVVEIETDKASFDISAPVSGVVLETFFDEGAVVPVFTNLLVIGKPGENTDAFRPQSSGVMTDGADGGAATARSRPNNMQSGASGTPEQKPPALRPVPPFSPRASRFAAQHNFHPDSVVGSGPGGRVLEADLRRLYESSAKGPAAFKAPVVSGSGPAASGMSGIRGKIARRMRESLASTAQYTLHASAGAAGLLAVRAKVKASPGAADINVNDLVTFCAIQALLEMPQLNAELIDGKIQQHSEIHMGFACDTPRGLMVPVIRHAHKLAVGPLALKTRELAAQAVAGTISPDNLVGATFTVSNLGGLGVESFTPLLNPPQVAILGVGAIQVKPVRRQGKVEFIDSIGLSLTCDHQVIDGAPAARFLQILREKIENVESLCG